MTSERLQMLASTKHNCSVWQLAERTIRVYIMMPWGHASNAAASLQAGLHAAMLGC